MEGILKDKVFISTRPANSTDELSGWFKKEGATLLEMPMIEILSNPLNTNEKQIIAHPEAFQWIVFTSPNGVKYFFEFFNKITKNKNLPASIQMAVIGDKTESVLNKFGYRASFKNSGSTGEDFAVSFLQKIKKDKTKPNVLLALGNLARNIIENQLQDFAHCTRINVYQTISTQTLEPEVWKHIKNNNYEMLIFTSPSGIQNFLKITNQYNKIRIACIGETTANEAIKNKIIPEVIANKSTTLGLFKSITAFYKNQ